MSAAEQLCLIEFIDNSPPEVVEPNMVDALLDHHHGNYRRVIEDLLLDADFLRDQLYTASRLMSQGYGRGWKPRYERV